MKSTEVCVFTRAFRSELRDWLPSHQVPLGYRPQSNRYLMRVQGHAPAQVIESVQGDGIDLGCLFLQRLQATERHPGGSETEHSRFGALPADHQSAQELGLGSAQF